VVRAVGVLCDKSGFKWSVVRDPTSSPHVEEDDSRKVPANLQTRGSQLDWVFSEFRDLVARVKPDVIYLVRADGAAPGRHEVEGVVMLGAHAKGVEAALRLPDQVRKSFGVPKNAGAYKELLKRPEVVLRSNADKRTTYLFAVAGLLDLEL
jgi:hypothetical protein